MYGVRKPFVLHVAGEGLSVEPQCMCEDYWEAIAGTVVAWSTDRNTGGRRLFRKISGAK